ncbi:MULTISPECIES: lactoylglutathione lyase [Prochlorococcus]|uniref:Lactoylglutathione lyase family enzyme n=1 Tax=Prochlorococcus marinus (strain SARG / CCMP1375 / SS120) TaxID=167539 RepID=Q7VBS5_PROMA|nr:MULTISPECIES: lactoylglutathione lyase [Prochlorococcus]AAQ00062.1 Lactoylglutathione lyase family enzyme [Prochlorococcus marinus subsp. marinus str. CCMP1375]KGG13859.1 lactoylglutathione lyase family enzyme [Prochlorococcus marinus str. LG]KGG18992.1 lactoylglutathione lyase family enzyme [Prochlorococcus marinus str. SS2]KGG23468.1 lactoylglutathione lyase family enzyme [Prochlorococcus marinus str. SS35]KGG32296.1 lactoylglutathione lyase family enzyme [Prochlorococcus marinus str. SS5
MDFTKAGLLIASSNPGRLAKFYSLVMECSVSDGITNNDFDLKNEEFSPIKFFKPSTKMNFSRKSIPPVSICFQKKSSSDPLAVLENWKEKVISYGAELLEGPRLEKFGAEAWFLDLDDNKFLLFVPVNNFQGK